MGPSQVRLGSTQLLLLDTYYCMYQDIHKTTHTHIRRTLSTTNRATRNIIQNVSRILPQQQRPRLLAHRPTFAATLSDVGMCIASLTSPNVPSPIVLLSTNWPTCISLPLGIGNVGGKLPDHLRRFAMALSPRADPLRLGAGCGVCTIASPSHTVSHRPSHVSCIRYAHEAAVLFKLSHICAFLLIVFIPFDHAVFSSFRLRSDCSNNGGFGKLVESTKPQNSSTTPFL